MIPITTRGPDRGTGIGLYMSEAIIEKNMDGYLTACNVDDGAEFRIVSYQNKLNELPQEAVSRH